MVCPRCVDSVADILKDLNLKIDHIELGKVILHDKIEEDVQKKLSSKLNQRGFELLDDKNAILVNKIKSFVINSIHYNKENSELNFSDQLSNHLNREYSSISRLFSSVEGITLEQFIIRHKIERSKELLTYNENSLKEIAHSLGYSSVSHLSSQFKKVTGMSPTEFKKMIQKNRSSLDSL